VVELSVSIRVILAAFQIFLVGSQGKALLVQDASNSLQADGKASFSHCGCNMRNGMAGPLHEDLMVRLGISSSLYGLGQAWLVRFEFLPTTTGAADAVTLERIASFQLLNTLVDRVTVHACGAGESSNTTEAIGFGFTGRVVPTLFLIEVRQGVAPLLFDAYLFSGHGT
jgi:hypothetical protein